jgi:hypothetical protein
MTKLLKIVIGLVCVIVLWRPAAVYILPLFPEAQERIIANNAARAEWLNEEADRIRNSIVPLDPEQEIRNWRAEQESRLLIQHVAILGAICIGTVAIGYASLTRAHRLLANALQEAENQVKVAEINLAAARSLVQERSHEAVLYHRHKRQSS